MEMKTKSSIQNITYLSEINLFILLIARQFIYCKGVRMLIMSLSGVAFSVYFF